MIYPNPSDGETVNVLFPGGETSDVTVRIFTVAFRLVLQQEFPQAPMGTAARIELRDKDGVLLADGLYYVVVSSDQGRYVAKLLILR